MRLGACDYVTKPFTSEEITWAVQRVLATRRIARTGDGDAADEAAAALAAESRSCSGTSPGFGWRSTGRPVSGRCCPGCAAGQPTGVRLPRIGEVVYQGLPLAGVTVPGSQRSGRLTGLRRGDGGERAAAQAIRIGW